MLSLSFEVAGQIFVVTGHLIIWVAIAQAARDPGAYQYPHENFSNAEAQMKMIFQEIFPLKNPVMYQSKMDTAPLSVLFFITVTHYTFF